jgi:hypothetical protein
MAIKPETFRRLALKLQGAVEAAHMGHPDFRVAGKIFATLWPDYKTAMVVLLPAQQQLFVREFPKVFEPAAGAWGRRGCTKVNLAAASRPSVAAALEAAWGNAAGA